MKVTCFIEYKINPYKLKEFTVYAKSWGKIIPSCGGELVGYFLPHEGSNDRAFGIISFNSLADYESYRKRLKNDEDGINNFSYAQEHQFIIEERRSFLSAVPECYMKLSEETI